MYNADGYFEENLSGAYSVNNITGQREEDGTITVRFEGPGCAQHAADHGGLELPGVVVSPAPRGAGRLLDLPWHPPGVTAQRAGCRWQAR